MRNEFRGLDALRSILGRSVARGANGGERPIVIVAIADADWSGGEGYGIVGSSASADDARARAIEIATAEGQAWVERASARPYLIAAFQRFGSRIVESREPRPRRGEFPAGPPFREPTVEIARTIDPCLHCGLRPGSQARGLCGTCYLDSEIRPRYPSATEARRAAGLLEPKLMCRHCWWRAANKSRGLCNQCYQTQAIREMYPAIPPGERWRRRLAQGD